MDRSTLSTLLLVFAALVYVAGQVAPAVSAPCAAAAQDAALSVDGDHDHHGMTPQDSEKAAGADCCGECDKVCSVQHCSSSVALIDSRWRGGSQLAAAPDPAPLHLLTSPFGPALFRPPIFA